MADTQPRSAAMTQLLKSLGDSVSGFLITPPGFDAPAAMINITPLPGDFPLHEAFAGPLEEALASTDGGKGEQPPMMEPLDDDTVIAELDSDQPDDFGDDDDDDDDLVDDESDDFDDEEDDDDEEDY